MNFFSHSVPSVEKDTTDRNRTSPFAFTGNKFEFRAVGASQNFAFPITTLNAMVTDSLIWMTAEIEKRCYEDEKQKGAEPLAGKNKRRVPIRVIRSVIRDVLREHYDIVFNGNNYSDEWVKEATQKRNLPNLSTAAAALAVYDSPKNVELFSCLNILSINELKARAVVLHELFIKHYKIEGDTMIFIFDTMVLPAALKFQYMLARTLKVVSKVLCGDSDLERELRKQTSMVKSITFMISASVDKRDALSEVLKARSHGDVAEHLARFHPAILAAMKELREVCDELEAIMDDKLWPLPKYWEMLYLI